MKGRRGGARRITVPHGLGYMACTCTFLWIVHLRVAFKVT